MTQAEADFLTHAARLIQFLIAFGGTSLVIYLVWYLFFKNKDK